MRRQAQEAVAEAARRRLELLGRELDQAGLQRLDDEDHDDPDWEPAPDPIPVASPGRHASPARGTPPLDRIGALLPESLRGRITLGQGPLLVVVALVLVALVVSAYVLVRAGGSSRPVHSAQPLVQTSGTPVPALASPSASASKAASGSVTVDVAGKVRRPGIAVLPAGSRVVDAIRRSGGARSGVDLTGLNLARVLVDGEQILVGQAATRPVPGATAASAATSAPDGPLVNLNTATAEQLDGLPGVGPVTAQKILEWRSAHGAFSSVDELLEVDGIGEKTLADIAPRATL